jgi:tetratricopeptide (TPR) repeat protein
LFEANDDRFNTALTYSGLGEIAIREGKYDAAVKLLEKSLLVRRELGDRWGIAAALGSLAWVALLRGNFQSATAILRESMAIRKVIGDKGGLAWCLEKLAEIAVMQGEMMRAAKVLGAANAFRTSINSIVDPADQPHYKEIIEKIRSALGDVTFEALRDEGQVMTIEQVVQSSLNFS